MAQTPEFVRRVNAALADEKAAFQGTLLTILGPLNGIAAQAGSGISGTDMLH